MKIKKLAEFFFLILNQPQSFEILVYFDDLPHILVS